MTLSPSGAMSMPCNCEADSSDASIDLPDMPAAAFEAVLEHMYTGQPEKTADLLDMFGKQKPHSLTGIPDT